MSMSDVAWSWLGNTSNPSSIYQSELINTDGAIYHLLEVVDFDQPEQPPKSKEFGRFINIAPVLEQQEIVVANQDEIDSAFAAIVSLGTTEDNLFVPSVLISISWFWFCVPPSVFI